MNTSCPLCSSTELFKSLLFPSFAFYTKSKHTTPVVWSAGQKQNKKNKTINTALIFKQKEQLLCNIWNISEVKVEYFEIKL